MQTFDPRSIKVIGFDADDTLWVNEPYYRDTEKELCRLLSKYASDEEVNAKLYEIEIGNLDLYGYGTKAFVLSLIETALAISAHQVTATEIEQIIELGKEQIRIRNPLLPGVVEVLEALMPHFRLIVATKGDLLDQERKLKNSGISGFFHHIEVMSDKKAANYQRLLGHLDIPARQFLMVGNSMKSDVLPVVQLGGYAFHVPYHVTWQHEELQQHEMPGSRFLSVARITEILPLLIP